MIREQNYNLVLIGSGKYTNVYCMEIDPVHKMAVKVLKPAFEKNRFFQEQLINEAQLTQRVQHPSVRKVFEIIRNEEDGTYQVMMEFIDGYNMEQYIQNFGSIPEKQVNLWITKLIPALAEAHRQGIVHGMISPSNLLITPKGELKIADFKGHLFESELFPEDADPANILYLSPEQIQHMGNVTGRSDIYSMGATMYSLLTAKDPYKIQGNEIEEVRLKILNDPIAFIDQSSVKINELIQTATAKNPADRFASFEGMLLEITGEKPQTELNNPLQASLFDQVESKQPDNLSDEKSRPVVSNTAEHQQKLKDELPSTIEQKDSRPNDEQERTIIADTFNPEINEFEIKQDHTKVNIPILPDIQATADSDEVDQEDLDARAKKIWERIADVRQEIPDPKVDTINILTTSNIDAKDLGKQKAKDVTVDNIAETQHGEITDPSVSTDINESTEKNYDIQDDKSVNTDLSEIESSKIAVNISTSKIKASAPVITGKSVVKGEKSKEQLHTLETPKDLFASNISGKTPQDVSGDKTNFSEQDSILAAKKYNTENKTVSEINTSASSKKTRKIFWPLLIFAGLLTAGGLYWWQKDKMEPTEIIRSQTVVPIVDNAAVNNTADTAHTGAMADIPVNVDSIAEADTGSLSLIDLEKAKNEKKLQLLAAAKIKEEERKKLEAEKEAKKIDKTKIEILGSYQNGIAPFKFNGTIGFIRNTGEVTIRPKYQEILSYNGGLAPVLFKGKWGFVDEVGKEIIAPSYDEIFGFSRGLAGVKKNGKWGFINNRGNIITPLKYDLVTDYSEGLAGVRKDGSWGFVNQKGAEVIKCEYANAWSFTGGLAGVEKNGLWGFINKTGGIQVPLRYSQVNNFSNGLACVERNGKYGFIDKNGREVIDMLYDAAKPFNGSTARVFTNGKWIFINKSGKCVRDCN